MKKAIVIILFLGLAVAGFFMWFNDRSGDRNDLVSDIIVNPDMAHEKEVDTMGERSNLPEVTAVEIWEQYGDSIAKENNFAPSILEVDDVKYRIFLNDSAGGGIVSYSSDDGIKWRPDDGLRLENGDDGDEDCMASHPWTIAMDGGYRMYYQGNANCDGIGGEPEYRIFSAFSEDGLNFEKEGIVVDIGEENGLSQAAHGRIIELDDGTYRMFFSANFIGKHQPADILGATSSDGLTWVLDDEPILEKGHDPTLVKIGDEIHMYTGYLAGNTLHLVSEDGYNFSLVSWLEFYDSDGGKFEDFGDIDVLMIDEELLIYGGGKVEGKTKGSNQVIMKQSN